MIHRTFRSLDEAPKLLGFTLRQWAALIAGGSAVLGVVYLTHLPTKAAITLCVFLVGLPAALTYVSESGGLQLGLLLRDAWCWRFHSHLLPPASPEHAPVCRLVVLAWSEESTPIARDREPDAFLDDLLAEKRWG